MKTVALYNLGCKVNSYEIEGMGQKLREKGYIIVSFEEKADIYIVNTCTVTNIADRKSRQMLHRAKQRNPQALVVAVGCYVQTGLEKVEEDDSIDLAIGNNRKKDIVEILEQYMEMQRDSGLGQSAGRGQERGRTQGRHSEKTLRGTTVLDMNRPCEYEEMELQQSAEHTRAYIKIQDGCNQFCSYCVIPYARGRVRSRGTEDVLQEARRLVAAGYRELVLTGIHISSYKDGGSGLVELTERIHEIPGLERIRLGSLEPRIVNLETAKRLATLPKLCPHFHLSLQSGCDDTLKRMNRHYTTGEYYACVEALRHFFENPAITTDVIVGFPGETEAEFARTKEFLEKVNFYEMHVFKYSRRSGTVADTMPDQVPETVKTQRSGELLEMARRHSKTFRTHYIGKEAEVLLEEKREIEGRTLFIGHTKDYVKVAVEPEGLKENTIVKAQISGFLTDEIMV